MSGAEVFAVVGVLADIAQLAQATVSLVQRVSTFCNDANELPKVLKEVQIRLPLLVVALQKRSDEEVLNALSQTEREALANVLYHIQSKAEDLKGLLDHVFPPESASTWEKGWKAAKSFRQEKKAQAIVDEIEKYFLYLMLNDFQSAKPVGGSLLLPNAEESQKPLFMVNIHREGELVGRGDIMARLTDNLSREDHHNRISLVALGGMGKTRVALEYALKFKNSNDVSVFWIHASSKARIVEAYGKIAKRANIAGYEDSKNGLGLVKDWLESEASGKWLMVIDNADDLDLLYGPERLADYFPRSDNGSSIMTTRDKRVGIKFANASQILLLEALNFDRSQELLASKFSDDVDLKSCKELVKELEGIPLALVQAAAFIHMNSIDVEEYLELYRQSPSSQIDLLSEDFEDSIRDREGKNPVAATWSISFEHIERHAPLAGELLKKMCTLDYQAIPVSLLHSDDSRHGVVKALGTLQAFCLIHPRNSKGNQKKYDMHRLVHISMRNWLALHSQLSLWTARTLKILAVKYPDVINDPMEALELCAAYLPHALFMLASDELGGTNKDDITSVFLKQNMIDRHAEDGVVCASCASSLMVDAAYSVELIHDNSTEGVLWATKALSLRKFVYGERHSETVSSLFYAASFLYRNGQQEKAQVLGMQAVELIEGGEYPPNLVARGFEIRATIYAESDMLEEAEECYKQTIELHRDFYGPQHSQTLRMVRDLAWLYSWQERNKESEKLLLELLETSMAAFGPKHPTTIIYKSEAASFYSQWGRYDDSLGLLAEVSADELAIFGPKSAVTITTLLGITSLRLKEGRYDEALDLGLQVLGRCEEVLGLENDITLKAMSMLSTVYEKQGYADEAEKLRIKVLDCYTRLKIPQNPEVARETRTVASFYERQGRYKKAEQLRERVVEIETVRVGEKSREVILSLCELGINYSYQGLYDKASKYQYENLQLPLEFPKYKHGSLIERMLLVADGWAKNDNISDGNKMARDATEAARWYLEPTDFITISALTGLADICYHGYQFREAETLYREALSLRPPDQVFKKIDVAQNMTSLARILIHREHLSEAESMALQAKEFLPTSSNAEHSVVTFNMSTLAGIYEGQDRYSEAENLYAAILTRLIQRWKPEQTTRSSILDIITRLEGLAFLYRQSERNSKAIYILSKTLSIRRKLKDPTHVDTLLAVSSLGDTYNSQERYTEALTLCLDYNNLISQGRGRDDKRFHFAAANIQHSIAEAYIGLEKYDDAESFAKLAFETSKEIFEEKNNRFTLRCESLFGLIHRGKGSLAEGQNVEIRLLDAWTKLLGEKNLNTIGAMQNLAKAYKQLGNMDEARELEEHATELRKSVDFGLGGQEKAVDEIVTGVFRRWDENKDVVAATLERLSLG